MVDKQKGNDLINHKEQFMFLLNNKIIIIMINPQE